MSSMDLADVPAWDRSADVVVVGLGMAGACAALEAQGEGADVLALELASDGGGTSALAEGILYLGGGTALQEACGFHDDPDRMFRFLEASTSGVDPNKLRVYAYGGREHFTWLEAHGLQFERRVQKSKTVAAMDGAGLLTTGNEYAHPFARLLPPVPRGHQPVSSPDHRGGAVAMRALLAAVRSTGVGRLFDARVEALVTDSGGRVCGVRARVDGRDEFVRALGGVVLATGGFTCNRAMTREYLPLLHEAATPLGVPASDGAGIRLGTSVGATTENMHGALVTAPIYPPEKLISGIVVNSRGKRFVAEDAYHGRVGNLLLQQPGQVAYLILDEETFDYPSRGSFQLVGLWETVQETERALALPDGSLSATLDEYNGDVTSHGEDRRFHKASEWLRELRAPLAAFDISLRTSNYQFIALGGLRADEHGRALRENGEPVHGLYAVGACAAHLASDGAEYASGLSLGPGSFFGRLAGRHAAASATRSRHVDPPPGPDAAL